MVCYSAPMAYAQNAKQMLQACEALQRGIRSANGSIYLPPAPEVNQCWGFMEAVQQYATLTDQDGRPLLDACPGADKTLTDIIGAFVAYAKAHLDEQQEKAAVMAYEAMVHAFPCR
jgi:hypothetical protein